MTHLTQTQFIEQFGSDRYTNLATACMEVAMEVMTEHQMPGGSGFHTINIDGSDLKCCVEFTWDYASAGELKISLPVMAIMIKDIILFKEGDDTTEIDEKFAKYEQLAAANNYPIFKQEGAEVTNEPTI